MRNLKRALSLALASVMLLGMMVVGTSAKGLDDFSDVAEITNADAVAVTSAIGIFAGYDDGEFKGDEVVTRAQMAVICTKMLYGADLDPAQFKGISSFTDTPDWAEGYINLAASLGIIAGRGDGIFDPNATVTTAEAAVMLCKTLGYFQNEKDFGEDWMLAATAKGTELGLYGDLKLSAKEGLTRANTAEMVFNALTEAVPVEYNELLNVYYNNTTSNILNTIDFSYDRTLAYKVFDLTYKTIDTTYNRPGKTWGFGEVLSLDSEGNVSNASILSSNEIVTIADAADFVFTGGVTRKDLYKAVGKSVSTISGTNGYNWEYFVDGNQVVSAEPNYVNGGNTYVMDYTDSKNNFDLTNRGIITELYIDNTLGFETVRVVYINQYLGEVTKVKTNADDEEYVTINVLSDRAGAAHNTVTLDDKTFVVDGYEKGDLVVFTRNYDGADYKIAELYTPATVSGVVTAVQHDNTQNNGAQTAVTYIKMDGEKYTYNHKNALNVEEKNDDKDPSLNATYELYLDDNGYVVGYKAIEDVSANYLYVKDMDNYLSDFQAKVVLADGTAAVVDLKNKYKDQDKNEFTMASGFTGLEGWVCAYSVNDKGVYSLTKVMDLNGAAADSATFGFDQKSGSNDKDGDETIMSKSAWINNRLTDSNTVYVDVKNEVTYTGYENVPNYIDAEIIAVDSDKDNIIDLVFVVDYQKKSNAETVFYYIANAGKYETFKENGTEYVERTVYVDGEEVIITIEAEEDADHNTVGLHEVTAVNDKGYVTGIATTVYGDLKDYVPVNIGKNTFVTRQTMSLDDMKDIETKYWSYNADTIFVVVNEFDKKATIGNADDMMDAAAYNELENNEEFTFVTVVKADKNLAQVVYIIQSKKVPGSDGFEAAAFGTNPVTLGGDLNDATVVMDTTTAADEGYITLTFDLDEIMNKAVVFENGKSYIVVINGQECAGVVAGDKLVVTYYLTAQEQQDVEDGKILSVTVGNTVTAVASANVINTIALNVVVEADDPYYTISADSSANYEAEVIEASVNYAEVAIAAKDGYIMANAAKDIVLTDIGNIAMSKYEVKYLYDATDAKRAVVVVKFEG